MFGKLFGRSAERPVADPHALPVPHRQRNGTYRLRALGDARVLALVEAADVGDWEAVKAALAPFDLGRDHQVLAELADLDGVQDWIGRAVEEDKEHRATALLISGTRHISWGWEARTAERAVNVSQEQWRLFHERLHIAEEQLLEAAELRPEWVTPWRRLLTSGRGMSLGTAINETRRDAALRRDPLDLETHIEWVSQLQPRWGGEPGQALAFAREAFADAPDGHRLGCVIAMAHIEEWVESDHQDHLDTPRTQDELKEAADARSSTPTTSGARAGRRTSTSSPWPSPCPPRASWPRASSTSWTAPTPPWPWKYMAQPEKTYARFRSPRLDSRPRLPHPTPHPDCPMTLPDTATNPAGADRTFQVDLRGLVDLLSHHLYSSPRVYLRELLQNAVDALTAPRTPSNGPPRRRLRHPAAADGRWYASRTTASV